VLNKADRGEGAAGAKARELAAKLGAPVFPLSVRREADLDVLEQALTGRVVADLAGAEPPMATRLRHVELLGEALNRLRRALDRPDAPELAAEDVRLAGRALDRLTGRIGAEDVLDRVFSSFCIGK
jgi:tRNA modification GTPase